MKRQGSNQSRIFVNGQSSSRGQMLDEQLQLDNPENNFEKLMSLPPDIPIRQCRNLLQTMSEHCSFEKNLIKKTQNMQIPAHVRTQIKHKQVFNDYETIRKYTMFAKKKQHFENRRFSSISNHKLDQQAQIQVQPKHKRDSSRKMKTQSSHENIKKNPKQMMKYIIENTKPRTLSQIVQQKKNQMLLQSNILKVNQEKVSSILNDNNKRQKIFEEALFLQRLYDIQILKLKNVGVTDCAGTVPQKFRGVQPRHIRISSQSCKTQQQYLRKKYVCKKRKLQFYGHAKKIEQNALKNKKLQNLGVLLTIMKFNEAKCSTQGSKVILSNQKQVNINQQDLKIKKLFLKYSCSQVDNHEEIYKYIEYKSILQFFKDFQLEQKLQTNYNLQKFITKKKQFKNTGENNLDGQNQNKIKYFMFDFMQILYILAAQNGQSNSLTGLAVFLQQNIWSKKQKLIPNLWLQLQKVKKSTRIQKFLRIIKFQQKIQQIFKSKAHKKQQSQFAISLINFNDLLEVAWQVKLFPSKVSKKALRFIYLYNKSNENGLTEQDFKDVFLVIGLKFGPFETNEQKIKWVTNHIIKNNKQIN